MGPMAPLEGFYPHVASCRYTCMGAGRVERNAALWAPGDRAAPGVQPAHGPRARAHPSSWPSPAAPPPPPSRQDVKTVHWHPQGEVLVSASYDDSIKLWAEEDDEWICTQTLAGKCAGSQAACLGNQRLVCAHAPAGEVFGTFADGWRASGPCSTRPRGGGACLAATCCSCLLPLRSPDALPAWQVMRTGPSSVAGRCTYDRSRPPL